MDLVKQVSAEALTCTNYMADETFGD